VWARRIRAWSDTLRRRQLALQGFQNAQPVEVVPAVGQGEAVIGQGLKGVGLAFFFLRIVAQPGHRPFRLIPHQARREVPVDGRALGVEGGAGLLGRALARAGYDIELGA
jgi:hypothetical protein